MKTTWRMLLTDTDVSTDRLLALGRAICNPPEGFADAALSLINYSRRDVLLESADKILARPTTSRGVSFRGDTELHMREAIVSAQFKLQEESAAEKKHPKKRKTPFVSESAALLSRELKGKPRESDDEPKKAHVFIEDIEKLIKYLSTFSAGNGDRKDALKARRSMRLSLRKSVQILLAAHEILPRGVASEFETAIKRGVPWADGLDTRQIPKVGQASVGMQICFVVNRPPQKEF
jgi:hypothetical protein